MVSVAEQFGNLRNSLGSILGIYAIMRWARVLIAKITGRPMPVDISPQGFAQFERQGDRQNGSLGPRPSRKPLMFFILAVFGLPYLMSKLIRALSEKFTSEDEERRRLAQENPGAYGQQQFAMQDGNPGQQMQNQNSIDPSQLEFCRALFDFIPTDPAIELGLKKGDVIAVLSKTDPMGNPSQWWRGRLRDAQTGYFPSNYCEAIERRKKITEIPDKENNGAKSDKISVAEFEKIQE